MGNLDTIGRATFHYIPPREVYSLTKREERWLRFINIHGPTSSEFLYQCTKDTHRSADASRRCLEKLRAGGFLRLPAAQRETEYPMGNFYIYELTQKAVRYLKERGLYADAIVPSGPFPHQFMTATITGTLDIMLARSGFSYIPGHTILERKDATLALKLERKVVPDQLGLIDYGGKFRAVWIEADRGTEQKTETKGGRKTYQRSIQQMQEIIAGGLYKEHYGLKCGMLALFVFASEANRSTFLKLVEKELGKSAYILTQVLPNFAKPWKPGPLPTELVEGPWVRAGYEPFYIDRA